MCVYGLESTPSFCTSRDGHMLMQTHQLAWCKCQSSEWCQTLDKSCTSCVGVLQHTGETSIPAGLILYSHTLLRAWRFVLTFPDLVLIYVASALSTQRLEKKTGGEKRIWKIERHQDSHCTWSDVWFRGKVNMSVGAYTSCAPHWVTACVCACMCVCVRSLVDPFRPVCEWQQGLCKEPQRGQSGQSDRRSGQQSVTLNTSPWHRADTLCHRPTHCLSTLFTSTARACVWAAVCQQTRHWPPLCVCVCARDRQQKRETKISRKKWKVEVRCLATWELVHECESATNYSCGQYLCKINIVPGKHQLAS